MKIINFKVIAKGSLLAAWDVEFKPLTVCGMMLFRKADGGTFIKEPSESYLDGRTGEKLYRKHVTITDEQLRDKIAAEAKRLYAGKLADQQPAAPVYADPLEEPFA